MLVQWNKARVALEQARTIDEVKLVRDQAEALRLYVKQQGESLAMQNNIAEIKLRSERRAGELLRGMDMNRGARWQPTEQSGGNTMLPPDCSPPCLADLGISKMQSSRWQLEASLPEESFEQHVAEVKARGEELTSASLLQLASRIQRQEAIKELSRAEQSLGESRKYRCIVIDPPWPIQKIEREVRPMQGHSLDYPTMSMEDIAALPVLEQAESEGCHLYLWVTQKHLHDGLHLFERWGFRYQCALIWVKNVGFTPFSWMYSTELVLFGRVGSLDLLRLGMRLDFTGKVREHSRKPDEFYEIVKQASPGPRLEMFARQQREGFDGWGNEPSRFANVAAG